LIVCFRYKFHSTLTNEYDGYDNNYKQEAVIPDNRLKVYQDLAFSYDTHGNVTQRIRGNQAAGTHSEASFSWNADHQLDQATVSRHGVTQTTRYAYDALGRRVTKADAFGATHYLWDGDLMVHSQRGNKEALFVFEPNSFVPLATVQGAVNQAKSQQIYWYQCDQIGAPQELTDAQGHMVWAADYKVWGEAKVRQITLPQSYRTGTDDASGSDYAPKRGGTWKLAGDSAKAAPPPIEQPFRFQGQQFDEETGLHYNRFRYYDPVVGRFVSQDPIGLAGGLNTFAYAPNPFSWFDPNGLAKRGPKPKGCGGPHNQVISDWGKEITDAGGTVIAGGGLQNERLIATEGGIKGGRRPDIIYQDASGKTVYGNVGKLDAQGQPIKREREALNDLKTKTTDKQKADDVQFRAYCPCGTPPKTGC
jgi:RHS repeat-associated protein